ncbi:MAG: MFS transporter [Acidaminobacteraceae bacterium]
MKTNSMKYLIAINFLTMFVMAVSSALKGVLVPTFKDAFAVNNTQIGLMLSISLLVSMIFTYLGSRLCEKYRSKRIIMIGVFASAVTFFLTSYSTSFTMLFIGHLAAGGSASLLIIGLNTTVPFLPVTYKALLMNMLHFFYGIGVMISQKVSGFLLVNNYSWNYLFRVCSILFIINLILLIFMNDVDNKPNYLTKNADDSSSNMLMLVLITLALGFAISAEIHTSNWFINYMKEIYLYNENKATYLTAIFFAMFSASRFFGGFISEKFGYIRTVTFSIIFATFFYIAGYTLGESGLIIISFSGLFIGLIYPTTLIFSSNLFKNSSSSTIGIITSSVTFITFVTGIILGYANDIIGVYLSYALMPIFLIISSILYILVYRISKDSFN